MYNTTAAVGQPREEGNRCTGIIMFCVLLWMLQNTPHEVSVHIGCASKLYLYARTFALYGAGTPKQDAGYCEFYWVVNFAL